MSENATSKMRFLDPIIDSQTPVPVADYMSSYIINGNVRISWFGSNRQIEEFLSGDSMPSEAVENEKNIGLPTRPTLVLNMAPDIATLLLEHLARQMDNYVELPQESSNPSYICAACRLPDFLRGLADKFEQVAKEKRDECGRCGS